MTTTTSSTSSIGKVRTRLSASLLSLALLGAGCGETSGGRDDVRGPRADLPRRPAQAAPTPRTESSILDQPIAETVPDVRSLDLRLGVRALGIIGSDDLTLPLVRPDGRRVAVQYGFTPDWSMVLAAPAAGSAVTSRIEILAIDDDATEPRLLTTVDEPVLLGRSVNDRGFLVEAPRPNGSRWIGLVQWETGTIEWLVQDDARVSAFGSLGPSGMLAWSSRPVDGERFDLMVRPGHAEETWRLAAGFRNWLLPTWSGHGFSLFCLVLDGERLELVHFDARSERELFRTIRRLELAASNAGVDTAWQTFAATISDDRLSSIDQIFFSHPARLRAAVWRPAEGLVLFEPGSFSAAVDPSNPDFALVTTRSGLVRQSIVRARDRTELLRAPLVIRSGDVSAARAIAIEPAGGQQRQGLVDLRFLPLTD